MEIILFIGGCIGLVIGVLLWGVIFRLAARWVLKKEIPLSDACSILVINALVQIVVGIVVGSVTRSQESVNLASISMLPVSFLIQSGIISSRLKITFGKACLVSLALMGIVLAILLVVGIVTFVFVS